MYLERAVRIAEVGGRRSRGSENLATIGQR